MIFRVLALVLTFLAVGFADAASGLSSLPAGAVLVPGAAMGVLVRMGVLAAVLVALPAGVLAAKTGKKSTILLGLCIAMVGNLVPVLAGARAGDLLLATFLVGAGLTSAQVGGAALAREAVGAAYWPSWLLVAFAALRAGAALVPSAAGAVKSLGWHWTALFGGFTVVVVLAFTAMVIGRIDERFERETPLGAVFLESARLALHPRVILLLAAVACGSAVATGPGLRALLMDAYAPRAGSTGLGAIVGLLLAAAALAVTSARLVAQIAAVLGLGAVALMEFAGPGVFVTSAALVAGSGAFATILPLGLVMLLQGQAGRTTLASGLALAAAAAGSAVSLLLGPGAWLVVPVIAALLLVGVSMWPPLGEARPATVAGSEDE